VAVVVAVAAAAILSLCLVYAPGPAAEVRRSLVDPRALLGPTTEIAGVITGAEARDSELPSVELTVRQTSGERRTLILNAGTSVQVGDAAAQSASAADLEMSVLIGRRIDATTSTLLPWLGAEHFVLSARIDRP